MRKLNGRYMKRSRLYRVSIENAFAHQRRVTFNTYLGVAMLGALIGIIFYNQFLKRDITAPKTVKQTIEVKAIETTPTPLLTPIPTKGRRYLKYSYMPDYKYIISELQMLYTNWEDAADLNSYENGFDPMAVNKSSGACGLTQALPCSKLPCELGDIKCDLKFQKDYIAGRYGTVSNALKFHKANNWY